MKKLLAHLLVLTLLASTPSLATDARAQDNKSGDSKKTTPKTTPTTPKTTPKTTSKSTSKTPGTDHEKSLPADFRRLALGDAAPDFSLPGIDGKTHTLADYATAPVLMIAFLSNHCPYSHAAESRIIPLAAEMKSRGLAVVAINPNNPAAIRDDEMGYGKYNDTLPDMILYAKERGFTFPYLYDGHTQKTAAAYGCLATPQIFIFDKNRALRYTGRFDDSRFIDPATVTTHDARNAIDELLAAKPVTTPTTRVIGCSTKWLTKTSYVAEEAETWKHLPVTLEPIDDATVARLAKNGSDKLRLINIWATWCAPCVREFPAFVKFSRMFSNRDFEFISISIDDPRQQPKVLKFLQDRHAGMSNRLKRSLAKEGRTTNNYIYAGAGIDALAKALDPAWEGPVPYTILVSPDGKILHRQSGEIDIPDLADKIYQHLGAGFNPHSPTGR